MAGATPGGRGKPVIGASRQNTIGLASRELNPFLDDLDRGQGEPDKRRTFVRWPFRNAAIACKLVHPGGNTVNLMVAARNLSCGGISVLHNAYVYTGSRCTVTLPHPKLGPTELAGTVKRCIHRRGTIHELGIQFDKEINAKEYFVVDPMKDWFSLENVNKEELSGNMLHVDDSPMEQSLVKHYLRGTQVRLQQAATIEDAIPIAESGVDLVLTDFDLGDGKSGADLVLLMRAKNVRCPVMFVTADGTPQTREKAQEVGVTAFLVKPVTPEKLLRAVAEFLTVGGGTDPNGTTLPEEHPNRCLIPTFITQLQELVKRIDLAVKREDVAVCRSLSMQLAGASPAVGFMRLAKVADSAAKSLASTMSVKESASQLRALVSTCEAVIQMRNQFR
ncbi:MAG: response regulator [Phycisphaerales bacterium]|nr:response regulator [Phycisphaerales bacterium]